MDSERNELLMSSVLDIGKLMLISGAEIYRIEDTITRLFRAYGGTDPQVNAVPSNIVASVRLEGKEYTLTRRITHSDTDLERLDRLNALSRRLCSQTPEPEEIARLTREACSKRGYGPVQNALIYALTAGAFTLFFGGAWNDALLSAVIAFLLFWLRQMIIALGGNKVFVALLGSAFAALMSTLANAAKLVNDADKVVIGVVMVLIPGVELLNGIRDLISGDIQAGIMHISEALFLAVIIAVGAAGVFTLAARMGM